MKLLFLYVISVNIVFSLNDNYSVKKVEEDSVIYQYRIMGYDSTWKNTSAINHQLWSQLPAGAYQFEIREYYPQQNRYGEGTSLSIETEFPFWKQFNFWWLHILVVLIFFWLLRRYEIKNKYISKQTIQEKQRAVETERSRIARDFHDGIGSSLSQISITLDVANKKISSGDIAAAQQDINLTASTIYTLMNGLRDIIWALDPSTNSYQDLTAFIRHYAARFLQTKGIKLFFESDSNNENLFFTSEFRRNIFFITKEALTNVCKYSKATKVDFEITIKGNEFNLKIADNGCGFEPCIENTDPRNGKGLNNMTSRAEALDGILNIQTIKDKGTLISLRIPTLDSHII
ncbi:MAG: histidine kinase [Bacteroidota bacterium]|nr:histidine kinase [Bacteroidota bacterium]